MVIVALTHLHTRTLYTDYYNIREAKMGQRKKAFFARMLSFFFMLVLCVLNGTAAWGNHKNAYATMMYMGTPRDYEFYVATRVMIRSLSSLGVNADLVVIASSDVPLSWLQSMELEDGARVVKVENLDNPYKKQANFDKRFRLTLNKLYAWSLVDYERVVMLDSDNLFLQKTDELFQCGQFCAAFINPCIFHTGLFVLQPSMEVFKDMTHELENGKENQDGADQGFIGAYFPDLLDQPMFHPPPNGTKLDGKYRLPLGYQMDASYYYLRLSWNVPCGPNSVITFPGAPLLKPWYWWSWPVLPLGIQWHEQRRRTLGYGPEMPMVLVLSATYLGIMVSLRLGRPTLPKLCYRYSEKGFYWPQISLKLLVLWSLLASYVVPILFIPCTIHPLIGWTLYMCGSFALLSIVISAFLLPPLATLVPWLEILGALLVMAFPWYSSGIVRALTVFFYAFCCSPTAWMSLVRVMESLHSSAEKEAYFMKPGETLSAPRSNKLC